MNLQTKVFDEILGQFSKKSDAVKELSDLFQMGQNAIYRRMRGESLLTPDELSLLAKHFKISLDTIVHEDTEQVLFSYRPIVESAKDFEGYLNSISANMEPMHQIPEILIKYAASELPIFHYCFIPELIAFKLFTWGKTPLGFEALADIPFTFDLISPDAHRAAENLLNHYLKIPSIELWNLNILDNTLNQIEYYYESGSIARIEDALLLIDKMQELLKHLKAMAASGKKFPVGAKEMEGRSDLELFHNEMVDTNNTITVTSAMGKATYSTFGNPNFLSVTDQRVTEFIDQWFNRIMVKSQPLSTHGEKARNQYFNRLSRKVAQIKLRMEVL